MTASDSPPRVVFAGAPDFAVPSLRTLLEGPETVVGVLTQPDRPAGRGRKLRPTPVRAAAEEAGVPVACPGSLKDEQERAVLTDWAPDVLVVAAYGLILPAAVLELPPLGCINVHASLLPAYRGAAPIQRAIVDGVERTGITIMRMTTGLDRGPILLQRERPIGPRETGGDVHDALADLGATALREALDALVGDGLTERPQPEAGASYAPPIDKSEAELDWTRPAEALDRQVRAFNPWPVAYTFADGERLRVWQAWPEVASADATPGTVLKGAEPSVACGEGQLILAEVQPPGRQRMTGAEALRGGYLVPGQLLGTPPAE